MKYAKAIAAAVGSVVTVLTGVLADNILSTDEWASLTSAAVAAALTVYAVVKVQNKDA
jgi:hypothetical protein